MQINILPLLTVTDAHFTSQLKALHMFHTHTHTHTHKRTHAHAQMYGVCCNITCCNKPTDTYMGTVIKSPSVLTRLLSHSFSCFILSVFPSFFISVSVNRRFSVTSLCPPCVCRQSADDEPRGRLHSVDMATVLSWSCDPSWHPPIVGAN